MVLDRVHPVTTTHRVAVEHEHRHSLVSPERVLERICELAATAGVDLKLLPPTIDGTCKDVTS
jgi:hypothetical protein